MPRDLTDIRHQRSIGAATVSLWADGGMTQLHDLHQSGSAKAMMAHARAPRPEVVFLNTSGGLTSSDRLDYTVVLGPGAQAVATTQTAERAYRAADGPARVTVAHRVGSGGWLDWLPQETILFESANLQRYTTVDLAGDAGCLILESVILGRRAMGEVVRRLAFSDRRTIIRDGRPVLIEPLRLDDAALRAGSAMLAGHCAFASLAMVGPGVGDALAPLRSVLDEPGTTAAASAFDGKLVLRILAQDGQPLRRQILRAMAVLRNAPPPRVWQI